MFGLFQEKKQLRRQLEILELELSLSKTELEISKEAWKRNLDESFEERRKLTRLLSEEQSKNRKLEDELRDARRDADLRDKMLGWNLGALIYFIEQRWEPKTLLELLYEKLSCVGRRSAAIEYFRSHGFEVKDE
ncbi:hypothetical protein ACX1DQ_001422 [Salmonella enterica subsp. enterica serovar Newport]|jgi:hypothetical protein|uniref:Uncharacterized protein n=2 Tax=Seoulvirus SPN3US TaxID=1984796 RepID=G5DEM5_9CAUD|nr:MULTISPECIES: hypothetical protein [Enterobacterales]YP_009153426.1 hypothetical protein ACQ60_gp134 [Salmonella phage SPN3US]EBR8177382.1 hypothetical protein [Salmonella enterica subsp. enterica serovar Heidelberg]EBX2234645.1 hypothetical protein [Salmonella enterica subsp. enterica serovar Weltevreden]ECF0408375.1 hypothetical protein [Salmonella enterica subsp. enterica serovar Typhimurium]EDE8469834.1 hypothetical protein [Salmonella enterica subsp. enterica serovar Enteritidis]EDL98